MWASIGFQLIVGLRNINEAFIYDLSLVFSESFFNRQMTTSISYVNDFVILSLMCSS